MPISASQAKSTIENVLFESPTLAAATVTSYNLSSYSSLDAFAQVLTQTAEFSIVQRVVAYYQDALGRSPSGAEIDYYVGLLEQGSAAAGIQAASFAQIAQGASGISNASWNQIATFFAASQEFQKDYGVSANAVAAAGYTGLIDALYQNVLGRTPSTSEVAYYSVALSAGATPSTLMQWFSASPEFQDDVNSTISSLLVVYNDTVQSGGSNTVSIGTLPIGGSPTYSVAHSQSSLTEGGAETFTISTAHVASGTTLYYSLSGVMATEVASGNLSGTVAVGANGAATLTVALTGTAGEGLSGNLTASISTSAGGAPVASSSVSLIETAAPGLITLGDLGGGTGSTTALAINDSGQIAGFSGVGDGAVGFFLHAGGSDHAFFWQNGKMTDLGLLPSSSQAEAWGVNNYGEVVGWSLSLGSAGISGAHAFIWENGVLSDIGTMAGSLVSQARSINDTGQIVGQSNSVAFLWQPNTPGGTTGTYFSLGTLGLAYSMATSINSIGEAAGYAVSGDGGTYKAFLWVPTVSNGTSGQIIDLGAAAGQFNPIADGINASGKVIGTATANDTNNTVSWVWSPISPNAATGTMADLAAPSGATAITASAINNAGQIVGEAMVTTTIAGQATTLDHALLWQPNGTVVDLNSFLPAGTAWVLNTASSINDKGQVVGDAVEIGHGINAAYILTLPSSTAGAEISLIGIGAAHSS